MTKVNYKLKIYLSPRFQKPVNVRGNKKNGIPLGRPFFFIKFNSNKVQEKINIY